MGRDVNENITTRLATASQDRDALAAVITEVQQNLQGQITLQGESLDARITQQTETLNTQADSIAITTEIVNKLVECGTLGQVYNSKTGTCSNTAVVPPLDAPCNAGTKGVLRYYMGQRLEVSHTSR